jgi:Domain of unknown function (DUF4328)
MVNPLTHNLQRAKTLIVVFYAVILGYVVSSGSLWLQINMLENLDVNNLNMEELRANDMRQISIAYTLIALLIANAICFIMWFRRAYYNLQQAGQFTDFSEGWAAGAWFVPFLNLVRPYRIMVEIWEKTQHAVPQFIANRSAQIVGIWWAGHIISNIAANIVSRFGGDDNSGIDELISASWMQIGSNALRIGAAIVAVIMVRQASEMEEALYHNINAEHTEDKESVLGFVGDV